MGDTVMKLDIIANGYLESPLFVAGDRSGSKVTAANINLVKKYAQDHQIEIVSCNWLEAEALMKLGEALIILRQSAFSTESVLFNVARLQAEQAELWEIIDSVSDPD
jgi:hypothetical protein